MHKFYLQSFQQHGITIIPSFFIPKACLGKMVSEIPESWHKMIIKPAISAGSYYTTLFERDDLDTLLTQYLPFSEENDLIIQPFIPQIQDEGEISLVFFDKVYAHAVIKRPKSGDFRIQSQFGGVYSSYLPSSTLLQTATEIVQTIPEDLLYARVDGLMIDDQFHLMELELVEPDLYFDHAVDVQKIFVDALIRRLH
jgi:glutathione synthase/RimK-type ligase-like ATP-grasp enzyme